MKIDNIFIILTIKWHVLNEPDINVLENGKRKHRYILS